MNPVLRAVVVFAILWFVFRLSGRRTLAEITTFDFLLLLIIGDITQQALIGDDFSITTMAIVVITLVVLDIALSHLAILSRPMSRLLESVPVIVVKDGKVLDKAMRAEGVDIEEVLAAARELHGLKNLGEIRYAIVERHGGLTIVPADHAK